MSNVFNKELQQAIKEVTTELDEKGLVQENLVEGSKLGVYYAHGATEKAEDKLETDQKKSKHDGVQWKEAINAKEECSNIVTAATAAATDARNTNSAASTAAVSIQEAANSLTDLAADVAAILAVATAKDVGSKIQEFARIANDRTTSAARKAENTTLQSLNTTIEAAQSRAAVSLTQSKTLNNSITELTKVLGENFEALQAKIAADSSALATAIAIENEKKGIYQTALEEEKAIYASEVFINKQVNHDLRYIPIGNKGDQFDIVFKAFDEKKLMLKNGVLKTERVIKEYRIIFTSVDDAPSFDVHAAKATTYYQSVKPKRLFRFKKPTSYKKQFVTAEFITAAKNSDDKEKGSSDSLMKYNKAIDNNGEALKRGEPYVVFVYAVYRDDYQNEMNDTDGDLSLPSLPFILLTDLPRAEKPILHFYNSQSERGSTSNLSNTVRVSFNLGHFLFHDVDLTDLMDFRVILFNQKNELASKLNEIIGKELDLLFQLDEEYRLAEEAYLKAEQTYNTAVATDSEDIDQFKKEMDDAKTEYGNKKKTYHAQQDKIDELNQAKISNFILDEDVLANIPDGFGMEARLVTLELIEGLKSELENYAAEKTEIDKKLVELNKEKWVFQALLAKVTTLETKLKNSLSRSEIDLDKLQHKIIEEHEKEIELAILLEILEKDNFEDTPAFLLETIENEKLIKSILADLKELHKLKTKIAEDKTALESHLEEIKFLKISLDRIKDQQILFSDKEKEINYQIDVLNIEINELESEVILVNEDLKAIAETIKAIQETKEEMENSGATIKEIQALKKEIVELEEELKRLQKDTLREADEKGVKHFVAINKNGDFTDNYGEPLVHGEIYTALVYSIIKPTERDVLPLFKPVYSSYSDGVKFTLPQL